VSYNGELRSHGQFGGAIMWCGPEVVKGQRLRHFQDPTRDLSYSPSEAAFGSMNAFGTHSFLNICIFEKQLL